MRKRDSTQDDKIKQLLSDTKISANENLKFRIMQQIQTEAALTKRNLNKNHLRIGSLLSIFGGIYSFVLLLTAIVYFSYGLEALISLPVLGTIITITSIGSVFWMVLVLDEKRRSKH